MTLYICSYIVSRFCQKIIHKYSSQIQFLKFKWLIPKNTEHRNGKQYNTSTEGTKSESGSIDKNVTWNSSENVEEVSEIQTLTQKAVNEQTKGFLAPLTRQLKELTRSVQKMVTTPQPSHYPLLVPPHMILTYKML